MTGVSDCKPGAAPEAVRFADRAVRDAVLSRVWQLLTGPLTQLLLVWSLTAAGQDYFQAFSRMLGLQIFVELGLSVVLISIASHEWADLRLEDGMAVGEAAAFSRLASLIRKSGSWYAGAAVLFLLLALFAGMWFFGDTERLRANEGGRELVSWRGPWLLLVVLTSAQLLVLPLTAILEGCNQLEVLNRVRLVQAVTGTLTVWGVLASGGGLWSLAGSAAVRLGFDVWLIGVRYRSFFAGLSRPTSGCVVDWPSEVLPLQWRIAIQGMFLWAASQLPLLVIFRFHGEGEAGRLGMTWTVLTALQSASMAWLETRRPELGMLIAKRRWVELDRLFFQMFWRAWLGLAAGAACFCGFVIVLGSRAEWFFVRLSERLLPPLPTVLFAGALAALQPALCVNLYVRAHKRDPFLAAAIISTGSNALLQLFLGRTYGTTGLAVGYLAGTALIQTPLWLWIWNSTRREWHTGIQAEAGENGSAA
ncbi:MAG: hypothetical protein RL215_1739 [Planctomycetota bacterium]